MNNKIFLSYRREDAKAEALSIYQRLRKTFSSRQLFFDVDGIQRGKDFRQVLDQSIRDCKVLLAIIGPSWLDARDDTGARRIDCEDDFVRHEIATALALNTTVIPVLVRGAVLPRPDDLPEVLRPLVFHQAAVIRHESFFQDMDALVADLRKLVTVEKSLFWLAAILIIVVAGAAATWALTRSPIQRDGSDLRMETNGLAQAVPLANTVQPAIGNEVVYCDTASLTLLLSHNRGGKLPVLVNSIAFQVEPVQPDAKLQSQSCEIDSLGTRPLGIGLRDTYIFDVARPKPVGRYIESAQRGAASNVNTENILQIGDQERYVSFKPDEEPVAWRVFVHLKTAGLYRVWFTAAYDVGQARTAATRSFLLASGGGQ